MQAFQKALQHKMDETMKRFRELRDTQREMQRENMKRFQALDEKMDQLIKNTTPAQH